MLREVSRRLQTAHFYSSMQIAIRVRTYLSWSSENVCSSEEQEDGLEMEGYKRPRAKMEEDDAMQSKDVPIYAERIKEVHDRIERV